MSTDNTPLLQAAYQAAKAGRKRDARALVLRAVRQDPDDYRAWLWLASLAGSPRASLEYIERAESLRPNDPSIRRARAWAERRAAPPTPQAPVPPPSRSLPRWTAVTAVVLILLAGLVAGALWLPGLLPNATQPAEVVAQSVDDISPPNNAPLAAAPSATPTATAAAGRIYVQPKTVAQTTGGEREPRPTWTLTPTPSPTPLPTATATPLPPLVNPREQATRPSGVGQTERWINVDLEQQLLVAYEGDTAVFETDVSGGIWQYPTVTGQFRIYLRYESQTMNGYLLGYDYYLENVPFVQYFFEDYALHGAYWHDNFGAPMSHGCVNLSPEDAEWLFRWASIGTVVNVHN